jgi:hypothetical protein
MQNIQLYFKGLWKALIGVSYKQSFKDVYYNSIIEPVETI